MEFKKRLTNEDLRKKFKSQFELVRYAISLAENMILTGREARVRTEGQNRAMQILEEIATGKDKFDDIPVPQENPSGDPRLMKPEDRRGEGQEGRREFSDRRELRSKKAMMDMPSKGTQKKGRKILVE